MDVLVLCTGNICRSPMAELLLDRELRLRGVPAEVTSAGLLFDGRPAERHAVTVLDQRGLDGASHQSRKLTHEMLERADLVVAMEREHVREAAVLVPRAYPRAFTLKELVRRGEEVGPRGGEPFSAWLARLAEGREPTDHMGRSDADDIADPIGRGERVFRRCADEIEDLITRFADLAWPPARLGPIPEPVRSTRA